MLLTDLPFPITIVASDGWAQYIESAENIRDWGIHGVRKYNQIGFIVADANSSVWRMVSIVPERKLKILERFRLAAVLVPASVTVELIAGDSLAIFREHFAKTLEEDGDILTQFHTKEKIKTVVSNTDSLSKLLAILHKMRIT